MMEAAAVYDACAERGVDLGPFVRSAREVILFGSRAAGCANERSDWDILVIGEGRGRYRFHGVDIVSVDVSASRDAFLGSELATHVVGHGAWLVGAPNWLTDLDYRAASASKLAVVRRDSRILDSYFARLAPARRTRHLRRLRLDVQRLSYLERGRPVPPTAWLERVWIEEHLNARRTAVSRLAPRANISSRLRSAILSCE